MPGSSAPGPFPIQRLASRDKRRLELEPADVFSLRLEIFIFFYARNNEQRHDHQSKIVNPKSSALPLSVSGKASTRIFRAQRTPCPTSYARHPHTRCIGRFHQPSL